MSINVAFLLKVFLQGWGTSLAGARWSVDGPQIMMVQKQFSRNFTSKFEFWSCPGLAICGTITYHLTKCLSYLKSQIFLPTFYFSPPATSLTAVSIPYWYVKFNMLTIKLFFPKVSELLIMCTDDQLCIFWISQNEYLRTSFFFPHVFTSIHIYY